MTVAPRLSTGDPVPRLVLPTVGGEPVDLTHQSVAGETILLWLIRRLPRRRTLRAAEQKAKALERLEARLYLVISGAEPAEATPADPAFPLLCDPNGTLSEAFALDEGFVAIDASGRLAGVLPGGTFDDALTVARRLYEGTAPDVVRSQAPVLLLPEVLELSLCQRLVAYWEGGAKLDDRVATTSRGNLYGLEEVKKRSDVVVSDQALFDAIKTRLARRVIPEVHKAFQVKVTQFEALRLGCYEGREGGYFKRHRDNRTPYTAHRQFALTLNLNAGEYEGGHLRFPEYGRGLYRPEAGGAVVFSCSLLHEATPVTSGRRFALFTFFYDDDGAERERRNIESERAAGRSGVSVGS